MYLSIIKTGLKHAKSQNEAKRIQLLNTYAIIWIHFSLTFIVLNIISRPSLLNIIPDLANKTLIDLCTHISALILSIVIIILNKKNKFSAARVVFVFMAYFVFFILTILAEKNAHTIIFFALIPLFILSLYEQVNIAIIALFICLITANWIGSIYGDELTTTQIIQNILFLKDVVITALFFSLFFLLLYFKKTNLKNEKLLEKERDKVLSDKIKLEKQEVKLRELNEFKSHFFINLSHEIRTPITLIKGYTSKINLNDAKNINKDKLKIVNAQVYQVESIINNILDLSKLDANKLSLERDFIQIAPFLHKHYANFKELFSKKNITFTITDNIPNILVDIDANLISKSLNNLLTNSLKFTPKNGKVHIDVKYFNILEIIVIDNGLGIPKEDIHKVFERFYQSKNHITKSQGSGIGLSFTKSIIDAHGFSLSVESAPDVKTNFTITIPKHFIKPKNVLNTNSSKKQPINIIVNKPIISTKILPKNTSTILVVDDNEEMRNYLKNILNNYTVLEAENGQKALEILKTKKINLLVTDYMMPIMDGEALVKQVQKINLKIPIIVLTARIDDGAKLKMLRFGVDGYLIKPFIEEELLLFVKNSLRLYNNILEAQKSLTPVDKESFNKFNINFEQDIYKLILDNISNTNFGVDNIAEYFKVSSRTLNRKIKTILGQTAQQFINSVRVEKAREIQIKNPYLSQKEIAIKVGIKNASYLFKKLVEKYGNSYNSIK